MATEQNGTPGFGDTDAGQGNQATAEEGILPMFIPQETEHQRRRRTIAAIPDWVKNEILASSSEFVGTVLFLMFAFGATTVANIPVAAAPTDSIAVQSSNTSVLLYIALAFGMSLTVNAWVFFRISGGLFNPAVSFALALIGAITPLRMILLTMAQILGGMTAAAIILALSPFGLNVNVALSNGTSVVQGLFIEMFVTVILVFTIIMLAAEKHRATFIAPIGIGLSLFIAHLWAVSQTGCGANPARAFGPAVANRSFNGYHWIYWLGPYMGGALSALFYWFNKKLKFEHVNPGQDEDPTIAHIMHTVLNERQRREDAERTASNSQKQEV